MEWYLVYWPHSGAGIVPRTNWSTQTILNVLLLFYELEQKKWERKWSLGIGWIGRFRRIWEKSGERWIWLKNIIQNSQRKNKNIIFKKYMYGLERLVQLKVLPLTKCLHYLLNCLRLFFTSFSLLGCCGFLFGIFLKLKWTIKNVLFLR